MHLSRVYITAHFINLSVVVDHFWYNWKIDLVFSRLIFGFKLLLESAKSFSITSISSRILLTINMSSVNRSRVWSLLFSLIIIYFSTPNFIKIFSTTEVKSLGEMLSLCCFFYLIYLCFNDYIFCNFFNGADKFLVHYCKILRLFENWLQHLEIFFKFQLNSYLYFWKLIIQIEFLECWKSFILFNLVFNSISYMTNLRLLHKSEVIENTAILNMTLPVYHHILNFAWCSILTSPCYFLCGLFLEKNSWYTSAHILQN